jgi:predicted NAD/FAD-dependent oxidoreductase
MTAPSPAPSARPARVAVVGAGVSGLLCARSLSEAGVDVVIFDKGRGPGGRLSSRRLPEPEGTEALRMDHGAVDLCAPGPALAELLREAEAAGVLGRWQPREAVRDSAGQLRPLADPPARWVGLPSMSALARHWAQGLALRQGARCVAVEHRSDGIALRFDGPLAAPEEAEGLDAVVLSAPAEQTRALLPEGSPVLAGLAAARSAPAIVLMMALPAPLDLPYDRLRATSGALRLFIRDSDKPGRGDGERWLLEAAPDWSAAHLELDPIALRGLMIAEAEAVFGQKLQPTWAEAHRWRYGRSASPPIGAPLSLWAEGVGCCGDGLGGPGIEGAAASGLDVAARVLEGLGLRPPAEGPASGAP